MKGFRKHKKAVSPVLAVLLMIAVAVAASLVTYAWVMGYLGFTTAKVGKAIMIQSMTRSGTASLTVYVQNVGDSDVNLKEVYVEGLLKTGVATGLGQLLKTKTATIVITGDYSTFSRVKVKVVTEDGMFTEFTQTFT